MEDNNKENVTNWLELELDELEEQEVEKLPSLILEEGKTISIEIDFTKKFDDWKDSDGKVKAIIPVKHKDVNKNWWLNKKNPVYKEIIQKGKEGITTFKILQIGKNQDTKYKLVEDEE